MIFGVTICLLLYTAIGSSFEPEYIQDEALQDEALNEIVPQNYPYEDILYKPVALQQIQAISEKQAVCLNTYSTTQDALHASVWAPSSNSKRHAKLKVVCKKDTEPKLWLAQSKHRDEPSQAKIPPLTYKGGHIALVNLDGLSDGLNAELSGCNVCVRKNEIDPSYIDVTMIAAEGRKRKKYQSSGKFVKTENTRVADSGAKIRAKRAAASFTLSSYSEKKTVGDSLTVSCSGPTKNITWKDASGREIKTTPSSNPQVKEKFQTFINRSDLVFHDITLDHQNTYSCFLDIKGRVEYLVFNLTVVPKTVPPSAKLTPNTKKVTLEEGDDYTVICSGNSPNITWKHSLGQVIPVYPGGQSYYYMTPDLNNNKTTLYFKNVTSWHSGVFNCAVNKSGIEAIEQFTIAVQPTKITFSPDDKDTIKVKENKDYDITCEGAFKTVTWLFNGVEVSKNNKDDVFQKDSEQKGRIMKRKLKLDDVQKTDKGRYTCSGILSYNGSKIERSFELKVETDDALSDPKLTVDDKKFTDSAVYLRVNDTFEITCKGDTKDIGWKGPPRGWNIPENTPPSDPIQVERIKKKKVSLKFKKISVPDEGIYTCQVTKDTKFKEKSVKLNVIDPAYFVGSPQSPTAKEGGDVRLECYTGGHPKPIVNWFYNKIHPDGRSSKDLIDGQNGTRFKYDSDTLLINNITYKEAGKYICEAKQDIIKGVTIQRALDVSVEHKPYPTKNHTIMERKLGTIVTLKCNMISNPPPMYIWYQRNNSIFMQLAAPSSDPELKISFNDVSKFGEYKCQASNIYGSGEQHVLVIPMEHPRAPRLQLSTVSKKFVYFQAFAERNSSFSHYMIEYKEKGTRDWSDLNVTLGETWDTKYEIPNLQEKTEYVMRVRSVNELGVSDPSGEVAFTTSLAIRLTIPLVTLIFSIAMVKWVL